MVGSTRKRVMHIWHAVETCKAIHFYPLETMQVTPKPTQPPPLPGGQHLGAHRRSNCVSSSFLSAQMLEIMGEKTC